ncbi:uncharacterized protein LOC129816050 [Salvelinus fontinalis]|uniref:uncharacterized protein LOC129816050 n=1 Tax=Salvelinus fontinalis TaxID=8038 RepID=UPI002486170E|nr:uncharacterized protein LOC129816050 [Salvelinus fontinalis]
MIYRDIDLKSVPRPKSAVYRDQSKKVKFSLGARLRETGEMFVVPDCHHNMRIRELKNAMELVVGVPTDFQRVCYLDNGANVKGQTPLGRGACHAAAAQGQLQSIQELLVRSAPHQLEDAEGITALRTATRWGQRKSTRQLFLFHWQECAQGVHLKPHLDETELFAHQKHDSQLRTWHRGAHAQRYMAHLGRCSRGVEGRVEVRQLGPPQNSSMRAQARRAWMGEA